MMINQGKGQEVVRKYKGKGGYSAEQRVTYVIKIMFMNYRVKKVVKTKFILRSPSNTYMRIDGGWI